MRKIGGNRAALSTALARVLAHIDANFETPPSIDELSSIAAFSRHHFHRQFSGFLGMSAYRYVQFMRMRRASWRLAFRSEMSVSEIALATGYEGPEAFARAFRQYAGLCAATEAPIAPNDAGVREFVIPGGRCALLRHRGSDDQLGHSIMHLYANWLPASGEELRDFPLFMQRTRFFPDVPDGEAETDIYLPLK